MSENIGFLRYECFNCEKGFDKSENDMCPYCHSTNFVDKGVDNSKQKNWEEMVYPCCKKKLPASLNGVAMATCPCGNAYLPTVIAEYNEMISIIKGRKTLLILCSECGKFIDLGIEHRKTYDGSGPFLIEIKCPYCNSIYGSENTNEADYRVL